ncbi:sulfatase family protein [Aestuariibaculum marinum]|uniref:Sulfatase n=1 Tax=Aestuariibaculum marinum TaxID=2683592 RepID=A0A8J6PX22_9FLAO|nr:sulfatase [Aestuariibaculum marinum]MBD0825185.1 sulfatase [Aestuariibaculum marinum]
MRLVIFFINRKETHILLLIILSFVCNAQKQENLPNILFVVSDDQSFAHTSFAGSTFINTPAFDRIAKEGIYFENCIAASPGCAPSRSALVTGRYPWQNEQSGQHASAWLKKYVPFIDVLEKAGYCIGRTGKGVDPFQYARNNNDSLWRETNAAGKLHSDFKFDIDSLNGIKTYAKGIKVTDYVKNFKFFVNNKAANRPFFFWFGAQEPHRPYERSSYKRLGKDMKGVKVPGFLPDVDVVRGDLLDYAVEIEWFDQQLEDMLQYLEKIGALENTIIIVTSDNGKPFPRAKANTYEYGIHVPMAIRYPKEFPGNRVIKDLISFVDIAPTLLEITKQNPKDIMMPMSGKSFLRLLKSNKNGNVNKKESYVFSGRERHSSSRYKNLGYPQRAVRSKDYLLIWNMKPERWPAGAPQKFSDKDTTHVLPFNGVYEGAYKEGIAYTDIDESPSKEFLMLNSEDEDMKPFYDLAVGKRPEFELFEINEDPFCLHNLAGLPEYGKTEKKLKTALKNELKRTNDPRVVGSDKEIFDSYKRYMNIRKFPRPSKADKKNDYGR